MISPSIQCFLFCSVFTLPICKSPSSAQLFPFCVEQQHQLCRAPDGAQPVWPLPLLVAADCVSSSLSLTFTFWSLIQTVFVFCLRRNSTLWLRLVFLSFLLESVHFLFPLFLCLSLTLWWTLLMKAARKGRGMKRMERKHSVCPQWITHSPVCLWTWRN